MPAGEADQGTETPADLLLLEAEPERSAAALFRDPSAEEAGPGSVRGGLLGRFQKLQDSVQRTRDAWFVRIDNVLDRRTIDDALYEELEEILIQADLGVETTEKVVGGLRARAAAEHLRVGEQARTGLKELLVKMLPVDPFQLPATRPAVILIVGVNGVGKTTTIAKLAHHFQLQRKRVLLAAGDTFRAAAIDQLKVWGDRIGIEVVAHQPGADPGAVVFDAMQAAQGRNIDVLIIDTAGRLHTKFNLMEELRKIRRVLQKVDPGAPHRVLLVMDATTGQNGLAQARHFTEVAGVTGIVLAKLDGTAKGGIVFAIANELRTPIQFVGTGEKVSDLSEFEGEAFVGALLGW